MEANRTDPVSAENDGARPEIFHLATQEEWRGYQKDGWITPPSLGTEGFVHCSWASQIAGTIAKHFPSVADVVALRLDPDSLGGLSVVEEDSYGSGQAFPHVYGAIPTQAVIAIIPVTSEV